MHVASFITSHGFGHAGRASAVLDALHERRPDLTAEIFTEVPESFLLSSLRTPHRRVPLHTDVGMVQRGPFESDLEATAAAVTAFLDGLDAAVDTAAEWLRAGRCSLVLCDISPLGIVAAARAGIPSVLVENFRWDWIYEELAAAPDALRKAGRTLGQIFRRANLHVQVEPLCDPVPGAARVALPVARAARVSRNETRTALGIRTDEKMILITTGGVTGEQPFIDTLRRRPDVRFVVTGAPRSERTGNVLRIANHDPLYLADVVRASDAVVGKLGYSTLAEVWREGRPFLRIPRAQWAEGAVLSDWAARNLPGFEVDERSFAAGDWMARLDELLALPPGSVHARAGQDEVAELILARGWL